MFWLYLFFLDVESLDKSTTGSSPVETPTSTIIPPSLTVTIIQPSAGAISNSSTLLSDDATPTIQITGVQVGDIIKIYTGGDCHSGSEIYSEVISSNGTQNITLSSSLIDGSYTFAAEITSGSSSAVPQCLNSISPSTYIVDTQLPTIDSISPLTLNSLTGGTISLNGSHFVAGATVLVGGVECTNPVLNSGMKLTCIAPPYLDSTQSIIVSKPMGTSAS